MQMLARVGVYAGSFDPITKGHLALISVGSSLFDELIILVANNPKKKYLFSLEQRMTLVNGAIGEIQNPNTPITNLRVESMGAGSTARHAKTLGANFLLRGMRNGKDFEDEQELDFINRKLNPDLQTIYLFTSKDLGEISSSSVKALMSISAEDVAEEMVTKNVYTALLKEFK